MQAIIVADVMSETNSVNVANEQQVEQQNSDNSQNDNVRVRQRYRRRRERRTFGFCVKKKSGNLLASVFDMTVVVLLSTALAEPGWFTLHGGGCYRVIVEGDVRRDIQQLGLSSFFPIGSFVTTNPSTSEYYYKLNGEGKNIVY